MGTNSAAAKRLAARTHTRATGVRNVPARDIVIFILFFFLLLFLHSNLAHFSDHALRRVDAFILKLNVFSVNLSVSTLLVVEFFAA